MPVTYEIDTGHRLVLTYVTGTVTVGEMFTYQDTLRGDPAFAPDYANLMDFSGATPFGATGDEIRELSMRSPYGPGARRAMVVDTNLHFGFARMVQVFAESRGVTIEVFRERAEALAWLDIPAR